MLLAVLCATAAWSQDVKRAWVRYHLSEKGDSYTVELLSAWNQTEYDYYSAVTYVPGVVDPSSLEYSTDNSTWTRIYPDLTQATSIFEGWCLMMLNFAPYNSNPFSYLGNRSSWARNGFAYITGDVTGGFNGKDTSWKLSMPVNGDGWWASPRFLADGEVRAFVNSPLSYWQQTEFTIYNGKLFWRDSEITTWAESKGADYSVQGKAGQKLYVNFLTGEAMVSTPDEVPFPLENPVFLSGNTTTNTDDVCTITGTNRNSVVLKWNAIDGAIGYEIAYGYRLNLAGGEASWNNPDNILGTYQVGSDVTTLTIPDLNYATTYSFAIRALSARGEQYHSAWFGHGNMRQWYSYLAMQTYDRYAVPDVVWISDVTRTSMRVHLNRSIADGYTAAEMEEFRNHFNFTDGDKTLCRVDYLTVQAAVDNPDAVVPEKYFKYDLTQSDLERGYVDIEGLSENAVYTVCAWDATIPAAVDACYNTVSRRTKGDPGPPITIAHVPNATMNYNGTDYDISQYQSMALDDILNDYMSGNLAENQTYYLEGGKAYHLCDMVSLYKGLTLQTNPDDLAAGKGRAKLYMGGLFMSGNSTTAPYFMLGRQPMDGEDATQQLEIGQIRFVDLDVDCPLAVNYGPYQSEGKSITGNYFLNMYSNGLGIDVNLLEWSNCTFQGLIRGFFRIQGSNDFNIRHIKMTGCDFYNCGYFSQNGADFGYFCGDHNGKKKSNVFEDIEISNCVFYNSPKRNLITDNNRNIQWDESVRWNINVHHNTFVNFSTQANNPIINTRYIPGGSVLGFHDNVIILTKDAADVNRSMMSAGWDARNIQGGDGTGKCTFDIYNNWTTNDAEYLTNGQPFAANAFDATSNAPGRFIRGGEGTYPAGTGELTVHLEDGLRATDLMMSPNPKYFIGEKPMGTDFHTDNGITGLYYRQTEKVLNSAIYKSGAGSQRLMAGKIILGDANADGVVDVADVVAIVNKILEKPGDNFVAAAADVNGDGAIDVGDVVATVNIILIK